MCTPISRLLTTTALSAPLALMPVGMEHAAANEIGTVAAVNPSMDGTPPASRKRTLALGTNIIENERVETSDNGSGQLLFNDQTTLTVAPQSDLVLDKYVYDPGGQSGEITLSMSKGVLRFIGGRITKTRDATIRTPTATIGIRGGLALVLVESNGQTRVCHLAGEYSHVQPDVGGDIYLSRPNACAVVDGVSAGFTGLIDSTELQEIYDRLEGRGDGGAAPTTAAASTEGISIINSDQRGGEDNEPVSTSGESSPQDRSNRDELEQPQDDGIRVVGVQNPNLPPPGGGAGPVVTNLAGGAILPGANNPFFEVQIGSLIGLADGGEIVFPVPGTGDSETFFDTDSILSDLGNPTIAALPEAELFRFSAEDGAESSLLDGNGNSFGPIEGVGLFDEGQEFLYAEFIPSDPVDPVDADPEFGGFAVMGNPTAFQGQFFQNDAQIVANDRQSIIPGAGSDPNGIPPGVEPTLPPGGLIPPNQGPTTGGNIVVDTVGTPFVAIVDPNLLEEVDIRNGVTNTVEGFLFEPNIFFETEPLRGQTPLFMIGNQGMARFASSLVSVPRGLTGGGKWLSGALYIGNTELGQQSHLFVLADDIESQTQNSQARLSSGPQLATTVIGTTSFDEREEDGTVGVVLHRLEQGTFEDISGNTLFGVDFDSAGANTGNYLVISSASRDEEGVGTTFGPGFEFNAGEEVELAAATTITGNTFTQFDREVIEAGPSVNLLTHDDDLTQVITDPLPLAGARLISGYDASFNELTAGFATGMARCETGLCGRQVDGLFTGIYGVSGNAQFFFDSDGPDFFEIDNEVDASFEVFAGAAGDVVGNSEGVTAIRFNGGGDGSAFIDDNRFGVSDAGAAAQINDSTASADLALASSGLVGDGGIFPAGVDVEHRFLRWGWWSASYDLTHRVGDPAAPTEANRTDVVHLGNWVAGVDPNFEDEIPFNVTASYAGLAVGTMTDLLDGTTTVVGGGFDLTYTFQGSVSGGTLDLEIPDAGINAQIDVFANDADGLRYAGFNTETIPLTKTIANSTDISGQFFSDGVGNPTVATGGSFTHEDFVGNTQTTGIFGGDRLIE